MAGSLIGSDFTYTSGTGTQRYQFTVSVNQASVVTVRDIRTPTGLIMDSMTGLPSSVVQDIQTAITQAEDLLAATSAVNGIATFVAATESTITFATPLAGTTYRVVLTPDAFVAARAVNKTTTGFTIQMNVTFTGTVGYDVFL